MNARQKEGFTCSQWEKLDYVKKHQPSRYERLKSFFKALNSDNRKGRVLNMKGEVLHKGFEK